MEHLFPQPHSSFDGYYNSRQLVDPRGPLYLVPRAVSVKLTFDPAVPSSWKTAAVAAAAQWSQAACIEIGTAEAGPDTLQIRMDGSLPSYVYANGTFPSPDNRNVWHVGASVAINPDTPKLSSKTKEWILLHELGHNLGFTHPNRGGTWIDGTLSSNYATVMQSPMPAAVVPSLTADDIASRDKIFAPVQQCDARGACLTKCPG